MISITADNLNPPRYFTRLNVLLGVLAAEMLLVFTAWTDAQYVVATAIGAVLCILVLVLIRNSFRFALKTLLLATVAFGVWLGFYSKQARAQKLAVDAIRDLGGVYGYYYQNGNPMARSWIPEWLQELIGEEYFFSVADVGLQDPGVYQAFQEGRELSPDDVHISDADLAHLKGLPNLRSLSLDYAQISDEGLSHVTNLEKLQHLNLSRTCVTDAGMRHLQRMASLQQLGLAKTDITDAGLVHLEKMPNLRQLVLKDTKVTDEGVDAFRKAKPRCKIIR